MSDIQRQVQDLLDQLVESNAERGVQVAVYHHGALVVDAVAGVADLRTGRQVSGRLQEGIEPFETRLRVEFHDEAEGRTRLEIRQWLPEHLTHPSEEGWRQAFTKLDATLTNLHVLAADHRKVGAWPS